MPNRREFDIAFVGLASGVHEFYYEVDDKFFVGEREIEHKDCHAKIKLTLQKNTSFMMLKFEVGGSIGVTCDKCGNPLVMDLWDEFNMIVKLVENPDEMNETEDDPDIFYISRTESHLHLANWIYEFVTLSIPMQKVCKESETGGPQCNMEILNMLKKMEAASIENNNPFSKGLEKFKKDIN